MCIVMDGENFFRQSKQRLRIVKVKFIIKVMRLHAASRIEIDVAGSTRI